ncbi:hypothetical protein GCM10025880_27810 [Methylorubrum aminovorans]|nr:hypothetical protein GCM10025880_27810 [Methylorubrum aminovorans]
MAAVGQARSHIGEPQDPSVGHPGRGVLPAGQRVEAESLHPEAARIDDLEDLHPRARHLAGHRVRLGDDPVDRRLQGFRLLTDVIEGRAAVEQALEFGLRVLELDLRDGAARRELAIALDPALRDGDLLVELPCRWRMSEASTACTGGVT